MSELDEGAALEPEPELDARTELLLVLVRLVEAWHDGELSWNGDNPDEVLDLIARAEAAFDRMEGER